MSLPFTIQTLTYMFAQYMHLDSHLHHEWSDKSVCNVYSDAWKAFSGCADTKVQQFSSMEFSYCNA